MAINTQTIRIDLNTGRTIPVAFAHQNDTNRQLTFQLYNNGVAFTPSSTTVKFAYKSPIVNGRYSVITGSQMASGTVSGNTVTVTLPAQYTQVSGVGLLTMILTTSGNTLRPVNIKFVCQGSADGDDQILNASDWPEGLYDYMDNWLEENEPTEIANLKSDLNYNHTAEPGYILRATDSGHGSEWAMVGTPTDAQAETAINAWLDAHPEATTTVQDWSLTYKKLVRGTLGFVTPEMFGATGDGVTDDSLPVSNAIASNLPVMFGSGKTYIINNVTIENDTILFGDKATLKPSMATGSTSRYNTMFSAHGSYSIEFLGLSFVGYDAVPDTSLQIPLFSFSDLEKLILKGCRFNTFQQSNASSPSAYVERTGAILTGIDIKEFQICECEILNSWGDELLWIIPDTLDRNEMRMEARNNCFINNSMTVIDFIGGHAILSGNYYYFADKNVSGVNIFATDIQIDNEIWEGGIINCYDNTEGGRFSSKRFNANNVIINATVHNNYNDASVFDVKSESINISNCYAKNCDTFLRKTLTYITADHKDSDVNALRVSSLFVESCDIHYQKYAFLFQRGFGGTGKYNIFTGCHLEPIENELTKSTCYLSSEYFTFVGCDLFVQNTDSENYAVFDVSDVTTNKFIVNGCTITPRENSDSYMLFNGRTSAIVTGCGLIGTDTVHSIALSSSGNIFAKGNDFYEESKVISSSGATGVYPRITKPQYMKNGILTISNSTLNVVLSIPIDRTLFDGTIKYLRVGYEGVFAAVQINASNNITLTNLNDGSAEYRHDTGTTMTLVYYI